MITLWMFENLHSLPVINFFNELLQRNILIFEFQSVAFYACDKSFLSASSLVTALCIAFMKSSNETCGTST